MKELEEEIEKPTGIWTVRPPELKLEGVLVSQDCGVLLRFKETTGLKCVPYQSRVQCTNKPACDRSPQLYRKITTCKSLWRSINLCLTYHCRRGDCYDYQFHPLTAALPRDRPHKFGHWAQSRLSILLLVTEFDRCHFVRWGEMCRENACWRSTHSTQHITLGILADGRASLSALAPAGVACMLFINEAVCILQGLLDITAFMLNDSL